LNSRWNLHARADLLWAKGLSWLRRRNWLRSLYSLAPEPMRRRISLGLNTRSLGSVSFPTLPTVKAENARECPDNIDAQRRPGQSGANVFGYLRGQFGLAESARSYARALLGAGYPLALVDIDLDLQHGLDDSTLDRSIGEAAPYDTNIIFVNPDYLRQAMEAVGPARLQGRYTFACWFWELPRIPQEWLWALDVVDEILVASEFVAQAFRKVTDKPILLVPLPLSESGDSGATRADFALPADKFIFLTSFDFHSSIHRKNPYAAIEAFRKAFPSDRDDVRLLVKTSNGNLYPDQLHGLLALSLQDPRILLRDQIIDQSHMRALQRCSDAYISLHRAEGFGLGLAECMRLGKPVVGTAWSGNMDFMSSDNSCLVDYSLVPVMEGQYTHGASMSWAQADTDHAAAYLRRLVEDDEFRERIARNAATDAKSLLSPESAARSLIARLDWLAGRTNPNPMLDRSLESQNKETQC
jgi:glycosyltransferase involved in cell wall biosynthesis